MSNTSCGLCYFADKAGSNNPCKMHIINQIMDIKDVEVRDQYYYIKNYTCMYGFSKKQYEKHKEMLSDIDIENFIRKKSLIKYYLVIDCREDYDIQTMCDYINKLAIPPAFISIIIYETDLSVIVKQLEKLINPTIKWKTHNFLTKDISSSHAIKTVLDTNLTLQQSNYIWINRANDLQTIVDNYVIEKINFIVNIQQPSCNFVRSKNTDKHSIYDLFMNTETYDYLKTKVNPMLEKSIIDSNTVSSYYD